MDCSHTLTEAGITYEYLLEQRDVKRDTIPSGLDENGTLTQGSSVTRNPGLEDTSPLGLNLNPLDSRHAFSIHSCVCPVIEAMSADMFAVLNNIALAFHVLAG